MRDRDPWATHRPMSTREDEIRERDRQRDSERSSKGKPQKKKPRDAAKKGRREG